MENAIKTLVKLSKTRRKLNKFTERERERERIYQILRTVQCKRDEMEKEKETKR